MVVFSLLVVGCIGLTEVGGLGRCGTCRLNSYSCPGHFGHIELPSPVYHPLFMTNMLNLLRGVCMWCHHFKMAEGEVRPYHTHISLSAG